jgi:transcription elongation factor Elf1
MENLSDVIEAAKQIGKSQKAIMESLFEVKSSLSIRFFGSNKNPIFKLQDKGIVQIEEDQVYLTDLGQDVYCLCQGKYDEEVNSLNDVEKKQRKESSKFTALKQERLEKSNQFLELYKQGLNRQQIGEKYGLSRERVRQLLAINPAFHTYEEEREKAKIIAELERKEKLELNLSERSLASRYLERVVDLWDFEKNHDLDPEKTLAHSSAQVIWLKCPIDGHSWSKKISDITAIWKNNGTSGCPACAGKTKKPEKQPSLMEVYTEFVQQYWNYDKNSEFDLDPEVITLGSNRKAWFKCPHDVNEWQASIASIVKQQWSTGNTGCKVCNGTDERKKGEWGKANPIGVEFPVEVSKYWFHHKNNELKLDPMLVTTGSKKEAWFKCPIDGHEWQSTITSISKGSWGKGNSGCPACRGLIATKNTSLVALYPKYIDQYWDYDKNNGLGLNPKRMFGKYKQASVEKKLPRIVRLDKIQNLDSHRGSHDSSVHHRINIRAV